MSGGFGFFDIILFAMLAAFLVYRLGSVLGKRTGHERRRPDPFGPVNRPTDNKDDNVVALPDRSAEILETPVEDETPLGAGITQIKVADPSFDAGAFLSGARSAFEMVVVAYGTGDIDTLRLLLSDDVYENFAQAIRDTEQANHTQESTLVGIDSAELIEAQMDGKNAVVTVKYVSEQVNATRDEAGNVVDGDPNTVVTVTDIWTFSRDTTSGDPNWVLIATRSSN
tara:strand:+ start:1081 stop:1758 length:678 start_codon:yes stop_codon:yes gene_type:complete